MLAAVAKKLKPARILKLLDEDYDEFVTNISNSIVVKWKDGNEDDQREIEYFRQSYMHDISRDQTKLNTLIEDILNQKERIQ